MHVVVIYLICILIICIHLPKFAVFCNKMHFMKYIEPFSGYSGFVSILILEIINFVQENTSVSNLHTNIVFFNAEVYTSRFPVSDWQNV